MSDWFERLPKVELHLHLEGAIPHAALWELVQKYGGEACVPTPEALAERFRFRNFAHFIEMWIWKNQFQHLPLVNPSAIIPGHYCNTTRDRCS